MEAPRPPALTRIRSLSTSGDSLRPQWMFDPPNFSSTFIFQNDLAGRGVEHRQVAAGAERVEPIAVDRRRRPRPVAPVVAEPPAVRRLPTPSSRGGVERHHVLGAAARAQRVQAAVRDENDE